MLDGGGVIVAHEIGDTRVRGVSADARGKR